MGAIYYIDGPLDPSIPHGADAAVPGEVAHTEVNDARPSPVYRAESVFHSDYAYLASRDFDRPLTRCDRCFAVLGAVGVVCVYALVWSLEYIERAQQALHAVTP